MMPSIRPDTITIDYIPQGGPRSTTGLFWLVWDLRHPSEGIAQGYSTLTLEAGALQATRLGALPPLVRVALLERVRQIRLGAVP